MLKKIISYQRLLLNSTPPIDIRFKSTLKIFLYALAIFSIVFMDILVFAGSTTSTNDIVPIVFSIISIWMINRILYGNQKLFDSVPVSRKYTALNIFLLSIIIIFILYIVLTIVGISLAGILFGVLYLAYPQGFSNSPPKTSVHQIIDTTKGNMLMLCILAIILFVGIAITFIKDKKIRLFSFVGFATIGFGLLLFLKSHMPIPPNSNMIKFLESFSIMPQANIILICVAITTIIICIASGFIGCTLYVGKSDVSKH